MIYCGRIVANLNHNVKKRGDYFLKDHFSRKYVFIKGKMQKKVIWNILTNYNKNDNITFVNNNGTMLINNINIRGEKFIWKKIF